MNRISPRSVLACWRIVREHGIDVFRPGVGRSLAALRGWAAALGECADGDSFVSLLDMLRAFALRERDLQDGMETSDLVATLPRSDRTVLTTANVVRSLVEGASSSLLIVGYEIREKWLRQLLFRRGLDGVSVTAVGDRETRSARDLLRDWPARARPLRALENVEPATGQGGKLHAKAIVADARTALIGSANFTAGGLRLNYEVGVRTSGRVARDLVRVVDLLDSEGWLTRVCLCPAPVITEGAQGGSGE